MKFKWPSLRLAKMDIYQIGGNGKMIRSNFICIVGGEEELLNEIYQNVKDDITKVFAKDYAYSGEGQLVLPLQKDSPSYKYVMDMSEKHKLHPSVSEGVYYTEDEIEKSEYFSMGISCPLESEGTCAADYGTHYVGGCPECGLGGKPDGEVLVDRKFIKKKKIGELRPDIFVSEAVKELIKSNELTGVSFEHELKDYKGRDMEKYYIMNIHKTLPPMSNLAWLIQDPFIDERYEKCGHQVVYFRSGCKYEKEKLEGAQDFNLSQEHVDDFRLQEIIVSARVRKIFKQNKLRVGFFPVEII